MGGAGLDIPEVVVFPWTRYLVSDSDDGYFCRIHVKWRGSEWSDIVTIRDSEIAANPSDESLRDLIEAQFDVAFLSLADVMGYDRAPLACLIPPPPR